MTLASRGAKARVTALALAAVLFATTTTAWGASARGGTPTQVLNAVAASISIQDLPSPLSPTISQATKDYTSTSVAGVNWIKKRCDPYWTHSEAGSPVPCVYGDVKSKKVVVLFGDSDAGSWTPAFDQLFKVLGYRLDVFGFIGCTTAPVNETATSQPGFPGQWKLCDTWHEKLPAAVRKVEPVAIIAVSSPWETAASSNEANWVDAMADQFNKMTIGDPNTVRVVMGTTPLYPSSEPVCLAAHPTDVQACSVSYSSPTSYYAGLLARDTKVAAAADATLIPAWQWFCAQSLCSPVISKYLVSIDRNHVSEPYMIFIDEALAATFVKDVKL